jgi:hypothetical protein
MVVEWFQGIGTFWWVDLLTRQLLLPPNRQVR